MSKLSQMFKDTDKSQNAKPAPSIDSNPLLCKLQAELVRAYGGETKEVAAAIREATASLRQNPR